MMVASMGGCGDVAAGVRFDMSRPVCLALGTALPIDTGQAERALREGVEQFGGRLTIEAGCPQVVSVVYDAACSCTETLCTPTTPQTAAYVGPWQWSTIHVCPRSKETILAVGMEAAADALLKHELGHVFGHKGHLAAGTMMADTVDLDRPVRRFTSTDVAAICAQRKVSSSACD